MKSSMIYYNVDGKHYTVTYMFNSELDYFVFKEQLIFLNSDSLSIAYKHLDRNFVELIENQALGFNAKVHISQYDNKPNYINFNHSADINTTCDNFIYGV